MTIPTMRQMPRTQEQAGPASTRPARQKSPPRLIQAGGLCNTCGGAGTVSTNQGLKTCPACGGSGSR